MLSKAAVRDASARSEGFHLKRKGPLVINQQSFSTFQTIGRPQWSCLSVYLSAHLNLDLSS